jgi:hypothetical protein
MPVHHGVDSQGPFYQWGHHGAKYHYSAGDEKGRRVAFNSATHQAMAAFAHGYQGS